MCLERSDTTTAILTDSMTSNDEEGIDFLQAQLDLMSQPGESLYKELCLARPSS